MKRQLPKRRVKRAPDLTVVTTPYERLLFKRSCDEVSGLRRICRDGDEHNDEWTRWLREAHVRLLSTSTLRPCPAPSMWAQSMHEQVEALAEWKIARKLLSRGRLHHYRAGVFVAQMGKHLLEVLAEQAAQDSATAEVLGVEGLEAAKVGAMRQGLQSATEQVVGIEQGLVGLGCGDADADLSVSDADRQALMMALHTNPLVRQMAEVCGAARRCATGIWRGRPRKGSGCVSGVTGGGGLASLHRVLGSELVGLDLPGLEVLSELKLASNQALQLEHTERPREGRGPMVICVDFSGSMSGERETWAKGVCAGFIELARRERPQRMVHVIPFNTRTLGEFTFYDKPNPGGFLRLLQLKPKGGTRWHSTLVRALRLIDQAPELREAHVVFITDDDCQETTLLPLVEKARETRPVRTLGVSVCVRSDNLRRFCDMVVDLNDLRDADKAAETLYEKVIPR